MEIFISPFDKRDWDSKIISKRDLVSWKRDIRNSGLEPIRKKICQEEPFRVLYIKLSCRLHEHYLNDLKNVRPLISHVHIIVFFFKVTLERLELFVSSNNHLKSKNCVAWKVKCECEMEKDEVFFIPDRDHNCNYDLHIASD